MNQKLRIGLAVLVGIPLLAGGALLFLVSPEKMKPVVEAQLSEALQRPASMEALSFHLFPPNFRATGLSIADDPNFSKTPFLQAASVEIIPKFLPLLTGKVEIESVIVTKPAIELIQNAAKRWNYQSIGAKTNDSSPSAVVLGRLAIEQAQVGVTQPGKKREEYSQLSAEARDYAEGKPFGLRVSATLPKGGAISIDGRIAMAKSKTVIDDMTFSLASLKGKINGEMVGEALHLEIEVPKSPIADLAPLFLPKGMSVQGDVVAKIQAQGGLENPVLNGRINVSGFEVSGGDIKQPVKTAKLVLDLTPERITLEPANVSSGSTQIQTYGVVTKYATAPVVEATLIAPNAQVAELLAIARAYGVSAVDGISSTGQAKLQVRVHGSVRDLQFAGSGSLRDANLQLPQLTKAVTIRNTDFKFESNAAALTGIDASIGSTTARGEMRIANFAQPSLSFQLNADQLRLNEMLSLLKESGGKPGTTPSKLTADGSLNIGSLEMSDLKLSQVSSRMEYRDRQMTLNPLNATVYGGKHSGNMTIDMKATPAVYTLVSKLDKIESGQLLGATTGLKSIVSGPMSANLNLRFTPADAVQMARSLNGNLSVKFDQGKIASFNLTNELALIAKFLGFQKGAESFTQFLGINGDLAIVNGAATTQNLKMDLANLTAALTGSMNLADQTLDLKLMSILDKRFSETVGGAKVGGFMTAAMANGAGNLMIPASIKGSFAHPVITPDPGAIAKMKLQSFSPKDPKQMMENVNSILDLFKKKP